MRKLLIIGSYYTEISIVERARKLGYYTIVVDYFTEPERTPAKAVADEAWDMSWTDIDALAEKCRKEHVAGVLAGYSEGRVESMILLCERLDLPCGLTLEQFDLTRDKEKFKSACRSHGLEVVPEYRYDEVRSFPVIVKPVDRGGSIGITVAYTQAQLEQAYAYALSMAQSKKVVIEDFITDGTKVDVYYYVKNHQISLLGMSDTIMCKGLDGAEVLQKGWLFPSQYVKLYLAETDEKVKMFLRSLNIDNQYLTMSAFYKEGHFFFFEAGFRLSGEMSFHYYQHVSGVDYLEEMIKYAMGDVDATLLPQLDFTNTPSVILNYFVKDGVIGQIVNKDIIYKHADVCDLLLYAREGDVIHNKTRLLKKVAMCTLFSEHLAESVQEVNRLFEVKDENGHDMIYERVFEDELKNITN